MSDYLAISTSQIDLYFSLFERLLYLSIRERVRSLPVFLGPGLVVHVIVSDLILVPLLRRTMVVGF